MNKYDDFISGERFQELADIIVGPGTAVTTRRGLPRGKYLIIYAHTHNAKQAMQWIHKYENPCVLITHNSDGRVVAGKEPGENDIKAEDCSPHVVRWYAQNVDVKYNFPSYICPLPIGLENKYCFPYDKARMLFDRPTRIPSKNFYLNFNLYTNPIERSSCAYTFAGCKDVFEGITIDLKKNGDDYLSYLDSILNHVITVSPEGNGLDCHRTWEALYLNRCVLVKSNATTRFFARFEPHILCIESWTSLSVHQLIELAHNTRTMKLGMNHNNILSFNWWKEQIYNGT